MRAAWHEASNRVIGGLWITFIGLLCLLGAMMALMGGCSQNDIGSRIEADKGGRPKLTNPSPVTLTIEDADKRGVANGTGPARFTSITGDEVQTFQTGTTPRDLFLKLPDGSQLNLSSGTDIEAEGLAFNPKTGEFKVAKFGTSSSEPIRAGNEAYDRLVGYWATRDEASKQAILAELQAIEAGNNVAGGVLGELIKTLAGL
jgi:hypothetical protein